LPAIDPAKWILGGCCWSLEKSICHYQSMEKQDEETLEIQLQLHDLIARDHHHHHHLVKYLQCKIDSG
jgi:hypothetical protein